MMPKILGEGEESWIATGIYGANYKLALVMYIFTQGFRFAFEPFFFSYAKNSDSKKVYEEIKQVPCYDKVWKNLEQYAKAKNGLIRTKYVLIPGVNDSLSEVKNWLQKTYDVGIRNIAFDIEDNWFKARRHNIPQYIYVIFDFVSECYKQYKIESCELYERAYNLKVDRENRLKV